MTMPKKKKQRGGPRPGSGRPRIMADPRRVCIVLERDQYARIVAAAAALSLSTQEAIRQAVARWLGDGE